jgi:phenylacetate-CoA ligase
MNSSEIFGAASKSRLLKDPYVEKIWGLMNDKSLFSKSPDHLSKLRRSLLRDALSYFSRHSDYYRELFERLEITPRDAELEDLARLAIPSDILRGEGHKQFLIKDVEENGEYFMSSGTTNPNPVKVYRSPLDLAIMIMGNTYLFEYVYGKEVESEKGVALFMAAPELRYRLNFVAFVHLTLESKKIPLLYGMDLVEGTTEGKPWQKLVPNQENILRFLRSREEPKLLFTAPAGVYLLSKKFEETNIVQRLAYKLLRIIPINLGKGGVIVTGGGTKGFTDLPPYDKIVEFSRKYFVSRGQDGSRQAVPFMDVYGMTETLTAMLDRFGEMDKMPHPLSEVFILNPKTFELVKDEYAEGIIGIFNPFTTSWLEIFYPGDIMRSHPSDRYYGKEYVYVRRLSVDEGWSLQRACGGTMEELMGRS